jgi:adenylate kinase
VRRPDDNAETLNARLKAYSVDTAPIIPYYRAKGRLFQADGMAEMLVVAKNIASILQTIKITEDPNSTIFGSNAYV